MSFVKDLRYKINGLENQLKRIKNIIEKDFLHFVANNNDGTKEWDKLNDKMWKVIDTLEKILEV